MRAPTALVLPLVGAILGSGCTLYDAKGEVRISPAGPILSPDGVVTLTVETRLSREAELRVDGFVWGVVPVGRAVQIHLGGAERRHEITAHAREGELGRSSRALRVLVDREPPVPAFSPAPGPVVALEPFFVRVDLDEDVDPSTVRPDRVQLNGPAGPVPVRLALEGARSLTIAASVPLPEHGSFVLSLDLRDRWGRAIAARAEWYRPFVLATVEIHGGGGEIVFVPRWDGPPETLDLRVDGVPIGTVSSGTELRWDSRTVADGAHVLELGLPGYRAFRDEFTTDNTPPRVVACEALMTLWGEPAIRNGFIFRADDRVCDHGAPWGGCVEPESPTGPEWGRAPAAVRVRELPARGTADLGAWADDGGNPLPPSELCGAEFEAWLAPFGARPVDVLSGGAVGFASGAFWGADSPFPVDASAAFVRVDRGGLVARWTGESPATWNEWPIPPIDALAVPEQVAGAVWLERAPVGEAWVRTAKREPDTFALDAARGPFALQPAAHAVAWTQLGEGADRILMAGVVDGWTPTAPAPLAARSGSVHAAAVDGFLRAAVLVGGDAASPAMLELHLMNEGAWTRSEEQLNADLTIAAADPAVGSARDGTTVVAWVEAGQVHARVQPVPGAALGPSLALSSADSRAGSQPRIVYGRVVFLERGVSGARFEVREWDAAASAWVHLPPLVPDGDVVWFEVAQSTTDLFVAWQDPSGEVRIRLLND